MYLTEDILRRLPGLTDDLQAYEAFLSYVTHLEAFVSMAMRDAEDEKEVYRLQGQLRLLNQVKFLREKVQEHRNGRS